MSLPWFNARGHLTGSAHIYTDHLISHCSCTHLHIYIRLNWDAPFMVMNKHWISNNIQYGFIIFLQLFSVYTHTCSQYIHTHTPFPKCGIGKIF